MGSEPGDKRDEHWIDKHCVRFVPPDLIYLIWDGRVTLEHVQRLSSLVAETGRKNLLVVNDLSKCDIPDASARRFAAEDSRLKLIRAMAMVGANYPMRVMTNLIIRATSLLLGPQPTLAKFVASEEEALAWLDEVRKDIAKQKGEGTEGGVGA